MNDFKIPFFKKEENVNKLYRLNSAIQLDKRPYYLSIKKLNPDFIYDAVDIIYNLQNVFNQPFILNKKTIRNILRNFLPYNFFLCLSAEEAFKLKKELRQDENLDLFIVIKKREEKSISIFTYTNNFYNLDLNFYNNKNQNEVLDFFNYYWRFLEKNYYQRPKKSKNNIIELYGNYPVVIFDNLSLNEAILIIDHFNNRHPNLPIDLMMAETRLIQKKEKVKWTR